VPKNIINVLILNLSDLAPSQFDRPKFTINGTCQTRKKRQLHSVAKIKNDHVHCS